MTAAGLAVALFLIWLIVVSAVLAVLGWCTAGRDQADRTCRPPVDWQQERWF